MMKQSDYTFLVELAYQARENAYAPYSGFKVGAALLASDGEAYLGCNVENAAFSATNCAERTALYKAVSEGKRHFQAIAVVGGLAGTEKSGFHYVFPCGVCRQVLSEFCGDDFVIIIAKSTETYRVYTLASLLPEAFGPGSMDV